MKILIKLFLLFCFMESFVFGLTTGHNKDDITGDYPNSNYMKLVYPDYKINFVGNSRVLKIFQVSAGVLKAPGANPATYSSFGLNGAYKFADNLDENVSCAIAVPSDIDISSTISLRVGFATSATTGNAIFKLQYLWRGLNEDVSSVTPDETLYATTTVSAVSNGYAYANFTLINPASTDKFCQIMITRLGSQDTCNADVYVIGLSLLYYINRLGE